jgi:FKBP-type peptidyl-prolyl cis-trans isomerase
VNRDPREGPPTLPAGLEATRTSSGLEYLDAEPGKGTAVKEGSRVSVRYRGWLTDGTLVLAEDRTTLPPAAGDAIAALEEGVVGMRPGGRRRLIVPSDLGYGARGDGRGIPPFATLIIDLEILAGG